MRTNSLLVSALALSYIEHALKERQRTAEPHTRDAERGADLNRRNEKLRAPHKMPQRPAAFAAAIAEIEKERAELLAEAAGQCDQREGRTRQPLARIPKTVAEYRGYIQHAISVLADDNAVNIAREATRRLLGGLGGLRYPGSARAPARRVD